MTMPSRGISDIQRKARGNKMIKAKNKDITKVSVKKKGFGAPMAGPKAPMSVGAANSLPMGPEAGMGMKKGGAAKKSACKGYYKGGSVDGCVSKGRTKGKFV